MAEKSTAGLSQAERNKAEKMSLPCDWQTTKQKISDRGKYVLENRQWADCKFMVGEEPVQKVLEAHRLVLAMASPVFGAMFFGNMAETSESITVKDVQPDAFEKMLEYVYTDQINLTSFDLACEICYCAKKYILPYLVEKCTKYIWSDLSPKNACRAYEFAKLFEEPVLKEKCMLIIAQKTKEVLQDISWEEIELGTLLTILDQNELYVDSEVDLFSALERWAKAECVRESLDTNDAKSLRSVIGAALTKIRFLTLTPQLFAEGPGKSILLTKDEGYAILMNISSDNIRYPMPENFSIAKDARIKYITKEPEIPMRPQNNARDICFSQSQKYSHLDRPSLSPEVRRQCHYEGLMAVPVIELPSCSNFNEERNEELDNSVESIPGTSCDIPQDFASGPHNLSNSAMERKYYCHRHSLYETTSTFYTPEPLECTIGLTTEKNICIVGVRVPAQLLAGNLHSNLPEAAMYSYKELLYAYLLDSNDCRLTYTHFSSKVQYHSEYEIMFNRPVYIQKNKMYRVGVHFSRPGYYPMLARRIGYNIKSNNILFTFDNTNSKHCNLIRSIVFTCP